MPLKLHTAPTELPVSVEEQKSHSNINTDADDTWLEEKIQAATDFVRENTGRQLVTATYEKWMDSFPDVIRPELSPLISVGSVKYVDTDGTLQTLSPSKYQVDAVSVPARIVPAFGETWPISRCQLNAVCVTFDVGYGASTDVPQEMRGWIMAAVEHLYIARSLEDVTIGGNVHEPPIFQQMLLNNWVGTY